MSSYVKNIEAKCVYGRFDFQMEFHPSVNIVHGKNGNGKTTLLHILANTLNGEYHRFVFLPFNSITIHLDDKKIKLFTRIEDDQAFLNIDVDEEHFGRFPVHKTKRILQDRRLRRVISARERKLLEEGEVSQRQLTFENLIRFEEDEISDRDMTLLPTAYFPAFRTMIDAWASIQDDNERRFAPKAWATRATHSARKWFGHFVPSVNYPCLLEIEQRLSDEIQHARLTIGRADRELLSKAFLQIFEALSQNPETDLNPSEDILQEIKSLFDRLEDSPLQEESTLVTKVYAELRKSIHDLDFAQESEQTAIRVLNVYREILERIVEVQEDSFLEIQRYLESVNEFLEGKKLMVDPTLTRYRRRTVGINFNDFNDSASISQLRALSSGERQIATLIYAATHMSEQRVVLIDEPEISLHIDWQRRLLAKMSEQIGDRQIIACTHSPVVGADYEELQKEIQLKVTKESLIIDETMDIEAEEIPF